MSDRVQMPTAPPDYSHIHKQYTIRAPQGDTPQHHFRRLPMTKAEAAPRYVKCFLVPVLILSTNLDLISFGK